MAVSHSWYAQWGRRFSHRPGTLILFLEDRGERLYAIDRMLTYLKLAGVLQGVRGLVFGQYRTRCGGSSPAHTV